MSAQLPNLDNARGWGVVFLLAIIGGSGLLLPSGAPKSLRPQSPRATWFDASQPGRAPAQLWDDPLSAVQRYLDDSRTQQNRSTSPPGERAQPTETRASLGDRSSLSDNWSEVFRDASGAVRVLICPIDGSPLPGMEDARIESRLALVAALAESGFVAADLNHIRYVSLTVPRSPQAHPAVSPRLPRTFSFLTQTLGRMLTRAMPLVKVPAIDAEKMHVPYEWFRFEGQSDQTAEPQLLVLWVRNDILRQGMRLQALKRIVTLLTDAAKKVGPLAIRVLGPTSSDMLVDVLVEDLEAYDATKEPFSPPGMTDLVLLAWNPTISKSELAISLETRIRQSLKAQDIKWGELDGGLANVVEDASARLEPGCKYPLKSINAVMMRTIGTDAVLADLLVNELALRDRLPTTASECVVVIHEWDSKFSRAMPETLKVAMLAQARGRDPGDTPMLTYHYLRGLDGLISDRNDTPADQSSTPTASKTPDPLAPPPSPAPVGRARLDYTVRLVARIDADLRDRERRPLAVGIFGLDLYDKLLITEVVRRRFPGVLIFTTDLHSRFLDPVVYPIARNVIIASHFDLRLGEGQQHTAPFRTSYQTSLFLAATIAVQDNEDLLEGCLKHRLYEVARTGAYDLIGDDSNLVYPRAPRTVRHRTILADVALLLVGGFAFAVLMSYAAATWMSRAERSRSAWDYILDTGLTAYFIFWVLPVCIWALAEHRAATTSDAEPMTWFQGISAWPVILLRTIVIGASAWLLVSMHFSLRKNALRIRRMFALPGFIEKERGKDPIVSVIGVVERGWRNAKLAIAAACRSLRAARRPESALSRWSRRRGIVGWNPKPLSAGCLVERTTEEGDRLWREYLRRGRPIDRTWRAIILLSAYFILLAVVRSFNDDDGGYARGALAREAGFWTAVASTFLVNYLLFIVWDAIWLSRRFIEHLVCRQRDWSEATRQIIHKRGIHEKAAHWWIAMQLIAERTEATGKLIIGPFILLLILLASTSGYFDLWVWSAFDVLVLFGIALLTVIAGVALRRDAERARRTAIDALSTEASRLELANDAHSIHDAKSIRTTIDNIRNLQKGALAPWSQNPTIRAVLIPFSGFGLLQIVEFFSA